MPNNRADPLAERALSKLGEILMSRASREILKNEKSADDLGGNSGALESNPQKKAGQNEC